ncbi:MAG: tetratricopeptide repeat protein [FCB group bacterium]|nr:tetratricopeptide repeat protein [FCB group bacterium]
MKASEAQRLFEESKRLFSEGRFGEALVILIQLDAEHPNDRHLLYPLALCMAKAGRTEEARNLCNRLIQEFNDPKAAELRRQLTPPPPAPPGSGIPGVTMPDLGIPGLQPIDLGDLNAPVVKYTPPPPEPAWKSWLLYGGAVVGTLAVILLVTYAVLVIGEQAKQNPAADVPMSERLENLQDPEQMTGVIWFIVGFSLVMQPLLLFGFLTLYGKLPYDELWRNLGHVALVVWGLALFQFVAGKFLMCCGQLISIIITVVFVKRTYGLETGETILWFGSLILLNIGTVALMIVIMLSQA